MFAMGKVTIKLGSRKDKFYAHVYKNMIPDCAAPIVYLFKRISFWDEAAEYERDFIFDSVLYLCPFPNKVPILRAKEIHYNWNIFWIKVWK